MTERFIPDGDMVRDIEGKIPPILTYDKEQLNEFLTGLNELYEENQALKQTIKKMGELGGFNKHMIKTICGDLE